MSVYFRQFQHLLPRAKAWCLTAAKPLRSFFEGLGGGLTAPTRLFIDSIWATLFPDDTNDVAAWEWQFGLQNTGMTEVERRTRLAVTWMNLSGGQDPKYIQETLQANGFPVYIHEWWVPGSGPPPVARDPNSIFGINMLVNKAFTVDQLFTCLCGELLMECGEALAECGQYTGFDFDRVIYSVPSDPNEYPYVLYFGGETYGDWVSIPAARFGEFEDLLLKICPTEQWLGLMVFNAEIQLFSNQTVGGLGGLSLLLKNSAAGKIGIDWGDGTGEMVSVSTSPVISDHIYVGDPATHTVGFGGDLDLLDTFFAVYQNIQGDISSFVAAPNLVELWLTGTDPVVIDGNMDAADTDAWTAGNSAVLSKQEVSSERVLQVAYSSVANPYAEEKIVTPIRYHNVFRLTGRARSVGGVAIPRIDAHANAVWTGIASTDWQNYDVELETQVVNLETDQSTPGAISFTVRVNSGKKFYVDWGDGTVSTYVGTGGNQTPSHTYTVAGTYPLRFFGDLKQLTQLQIYEPLISGDFSELVGLTSLDRLSVQSSNIAGDIEGLTYMTQLVILECHNNSSVTGDIACLANKASLQLINVFGTSVSGDIIAFSKITSLTTLFLSSTSVTGNLSSLTALTSLTQLSLNNTSVTGDISNLSSATSFVNLYLNTTSVSGNISSLSALTSISNLFVYATSVSVTTDPVAAWSNANIQFQDCSLTQTEVDNFLIKLDDAGGTNGTLNIAGNNATRSSASDTAKSNLVSNGWSVTVNE